MSRLLWSAVLHDAIQSRLAFSVARVYEDGRIEKSTHLFTPNDSTTHANSEFPLRVIMAEKLADLESAPVAVINQIDFIDDLEKVCADAGYPLPNWQLVEVFLPSRGTIAEVAAKYKVDIPPNGLTPGFLVNVVLAMPESIFPSLIRPNSLRPHDSRPSVSSSQETPSNNAPAPVSAAPKVPIGINTREMQAESTDKIKELKNVLLTLCSLTELRVIVPLASFKDSPEDVLAKLARHKIPQVSLAIARNSSRDAAKVCASILCQDPFQLENAELRQALASRHDLDAVALKHIYDICPDVEILRILLGHKNCPHNLQADQLLLRGSKPDFATCLEIAKNPHTRGLYCTIIYSHFPDCHLILENPALSEHTLYLAAVKAKNEDVLNAIAKNPKCLQSDEIKEQIRLRRSALVRLSKL